MVTPLNSASRAASTENLLLPPVEEGFASAPRLTRPLITMGESGDSGDSMMVSLNVYSGSVSLGPPATPGRCSALNNASTGDGTRSVPDIELHARDTNVKPEARGYRLMPPHGRCSCTNLPRAPSHESIRSAQGMSEVMVVAPTSYRDRIIRQHSQPETCLHCHHPKPSASLRHLPRYDHSPAENFASIAADSLRINGALRHFKQVSNFCFFLCIHYPMFSMGNVL